MPKLACHLEALTADLVRAGHAPDEAARRARIALGAATVHKEGCGLRRLALVGRTGRGLALRGADAAQESGVHGDCGGFSGAGRLGEYDDLLCRQEPAL